IHRLAHDGGIGIAVDASALPIDAEARAVFEAAAGDPVAAAMSAGDDYELLFTASPRTRHRLRAAIRHADVAVTRVGVCTEARDVVLLRDGAPAAVPGGYGHFG